MSDNLKVLKGDLSGVSTSELPLVIDMDGTFFIHDIFQTQLIVSLFRDPKVFLKSAKWIVAGNIAKAKSIYVREGYELDFTSWPINQALYEFLEIQRANGRQIFLCSGSNEAYVKRAGAVFQLFEEHIGSDEGTNLTGSRKLEYLVDRFGVGGFDYVGNSNADIQIIESANSGAIIQSQIDELEGKETSQNVNNLSAWLRELRVKHWVKNLLLFFPLLAAHVLNFNSFVLTGIFFILISALASGTYILNDLLDLQSDIVHREKRFRPVASGRIKAPIALVIGFVLIVGSILLGAIISPHWAVLLLVYLVLTVFYSSVGKRMLGVDIALLASLYTFRIFAGTVVANLPISVWLLTLAFMIFLSMSTVKRYIEISGLDEYKKVPGRAYRGVDAETVAQIGIASGISAVIVYAVFATSTQVAQQYSQPLPLLLGVPILAYWVTHLWINARRNEIHSDPIDWALRDKASWISFLLFLGVSIGTWALNWLR